MGTKPKSKYTIKDKELSIMAAKKQEKNVVIEATPRRNPLWVLLTVGIILLMVLGSLWLGKKIFQKPVVSEECPRCVVECPVVQQPQGKLDPPVVPGAVTSGGEEKICKYADGFNSKGKVVKAGTEITGPAFAKPNRDIDWGRPILVGETYTTSASDEVVWILEGDNACVDAQSMFFSYWGKTRP